MADQIFTQTIRAQQEVNSGLRDEIAGLRAEVERLRAANARMRDAIRDALSCHVPERSPVRKALVEAMGET